MHDVGSPVPLPQERYPFMEESSLMDNVFIEQISDLRVMVDFLVSGIYSPRVGSSRTRE